MKRPFLGKRQFCIVSVFLVILLCIPLMGWKESAAEVKKLKWAHFVPENDPASGLLKEMVKAIETYTKGAVEIKLYWPGQLAETKELPELCKKGSIEITSTAPVYYPSTFPLNSSTQMLPVVFKSTEQSIYDWRGLFRDIPEVQSEYAKENQYCLNRASLSMYSVISKKPLLTRGDFKGMKIRPFPGKYFTKIMEGAGAVPTILPIAELYESLMRGTLNAIMVNEQYMVSLKLYEVAKNVSLLVGTNIGWHININLDVWKSFSPEIQNAFIRAATEWGAKDLELSLRIRQECIDQLKAKGVQFLEFNQKDWEAMLAEAGDPWEAGKALLTDEFKVDPALANRFINRWHELNDEYASKYVATGKQWKYE